jgi:hypothetical protein
MRFWDLLNGTRMRCLRGKTVVHVKIIDFHCKGEKSYRFETFSQHAM